MTTLQRDEQKNAWELRRYWAKHPVNGVIVTMNTEKCMIGTVVGKVTYVAITGAFAVVDGWHLPCHPDYMLRVSRATREQRLEYQAEQKRLLDEQGKPNKKQLALS